jgi:uncharacterized protein YecT (DUF1311 family)
MCIKKKAKIINRVMDLLKDAKKGVNFFYYLCNIKKILLYCLLNMINVGSAHADCYDTAMTQSEMNQCAFKDYDRTKHLIDAFLQKQTKLNAREKASLLEAFNTYQTYVNQQCEFDTRDSLGGSIHGLVLVNCKTQLLHNYLNYLKRQTQCVEGDLSCSKLQ